MSQFSRNILAVTLALFGLPLAGCMTEVIPESDEEVDTFAEETVAEAEQSLCAPYSASVSSVSPLNAPFGQKTAFTVNGSCLQSGPTAFWIAECANLQKILGSDNQLIYTCTPSYTKGYKSGIVKDAPGGNVLKNFTVYVY